MPQPDVIVVGLGAMGGAIAYHLGRRGLRVLGLDRHVPPHSHGSSHGRTRVIREAYFEHPVYVPLVQRAFALWRDLESETGADLIRVTGAVMLGAPGSSAVQGSLRSAVEHGLPHEQVTAAEVLRRFPALRPDPGMVGIWEPGAGALAVEACVAAHLGAAGAEGAELRFDEPVISWRADAGGAEVTTARGRYAAGAVVLAAGAWMPGLAPELPLQVERQVQLWFRPAARPEFFRPDRCPVFLWELEGGELFYGLPDFGDGVKCARHHGGETTTSDRVDRHVRAADVDEVRGFLRRHLPAADGPAVEGTVCLYTNTPNGHFLIDRHPEHPNVWLVSACSGHGFKFAPVVGERVAAWVATGAPHPELAAFRRPRTGQ